MMTDLMVLHSMVPQFGMAVSLTAFGLLKVVNLRIKEMVDGLIGLLEAGLTEMVVM